MTAARILRTITSLIVVLILLVAGIALVGALYQPNTEIPAGTAGVHVQVHGLPIRVLQHGSGRDIVLVHGSPGSIEDWAPITEALASRFHVTVFDRPGHGYSGDGGQYSFAYNADITLGLIKALGLTRVILVGHSYGGATALNVALRAPAEVDRYVIVDSAAYRPLRPIDPIYALLAVPKLGLGVASTLGALVAPKKIRKGLEDIFVSEPPSEEFLALRSQLWSEPKVSHALAIESLGATAGLAAQSARYSSIKKPVHILAQADDPGRRESAERLRRAIAGSTLTLLPHAGHYLQLEKPAEVAEVISSAAEATP